jgi:hypothetical protein
MQKMKENKGQMPWTSERDSHGLQAQRQYPEGISKQQIAEEIPLSWRADSILWGYVTKYYLRGSGAGFVVPPYAAYWERIWGATPIEDLPRYKDLYAFTPYIKASIDVTVNLAISNGFTLEGSDDAVLEWLQDWCDEHNILQTLRIIATDMLVFGGGFFEICGRAENILPEEWSLKPLDPVNMRVRRTAYGDVIGYVQLLTMPPVVWAPQDICHIKWGAKSWWYEYNYGTSLLRPLLLIQSLINQLQTDLAVITHLYTKPMLWIQAGTPQTPFSDAQLNQLMTAFSQRDVATDVFTRGDVNVKPLTSLTKDIKLDYWRNYLYKEREAVLGVPKIFLGQAEGTNRATADVVMQEFVCRLRMLQNLIGEMLEIDLFAHLIEAKYGEGVEIPHIAWKPIWEPTLDVKAQYIGNLVQLGIILPSEARPQLGYPIQPSEEDIQASKLLPPPKGGVKSLPSPENADNTDGWGDQESSQVARAE